MIKAKSKELKQNLFSGKCLCIKDIREDYLLGDSGWINYKISFDILYNIFTIGNVYNYEVKTDETKRLYHISSKEDGYAPVIIYSNKEKFDGSFIDVAQFREDRINKIF